MNAPTENLSIETLRKQAKFLRKAWRAGEAAALARIRSTHPQYASATDDQLRATAPLLTDCQLVIARESGFNSWPQLRVARKAADQNAADAFVEIACLCYDDPHYDHRSFHVRAHQMLIEKPSLAEEHIWSAATAGNTAAVRAWLDQRPELSNAPGPHGWSPLLCACYSRVQPVDPAHSTFDVAHLLLDRGADPNTFTNKGNADIRLKQTPRRFTALAGVFGGGSTGLANQPPHPRWQDLAELLLTCGADPNDEEALRTNQDASLEILLRHGLSRDAIGSDGVTLMGRALSQAARNGREDQIRLLVAHNARTDEPSNGKLPWDHAMRLGRVNVATLLAQAGAPTSELDDLGRFVCLCMAGDEISARALLQRDPDLIQRAPKDMVHRAVWTGKTAAVKLVLELGFDPNYQDDNPPITQTGPLSSNEELLPLLLSYGASLTLRDPWYDSTAVGWAQFFDCTALRDRLLEKPGICLFDALEFHRFDRIPDILARDPAALNRPFAECISRPPNPEDWQTPLARMIARGDTEAASVLRECGAASTE